MSALRTRSCCLILTCRSALPSGQLPLPRHPLHPPRSLRRPFVPAGLSQAALDVSSSPALLARLLALRACDPLTWPRPPGALRTEGPGRSLVMTRKSRRPRADRRGKGEGGRGRGLLSPWETQAAEGEAGAVGDRWGREGGGEREPRHRVGQGAPS